MALLDRVNSRATLQRTADPISLEEFGYLIGRDGGVTGKTKAGVDMSARKALAITAWYSGTRYLSEGVGYLPKKVYRGSGKSRAERGQPAWMRHPDPELPWEALVEFWMMSLLHRGNSYSFKVRNDAMQVVGLPPIHPDHVDVFRGPDGRKRFTVGNDRERIYTTREIFHIPGLSYDGLKGIDPITYFAEPLGRIAAQGDFASKHLGEGFHLAAYLQVDEHLDEDQARELTREAGDLWTGLSNAHGLGVVGSGAEIKTLTLTPEQMQLLEARKWGDIEVSQMLRIPPHKIYNLERATFSNIEHQSIEAVMDGHRPWVERIETFVNFDPDLFRTGSFLELQIEGLLRGDMKARYESYGMAIKDGWMARSEPRRIEDLPHVEGLDDFLYPLNMAVVGDTTQQRQLSIPEALQKIYLAVPDVISRDEAREIIADMFPDLDLDEVERSLAA